MTNLHKSARQNETILPYTDNKRMSGAAVLITPCAASNSVVIDHKFSGQKSMMRTDTKCHTHITLKIQSGVPGGCHRAD